jgi:hypothetical protein
MIGSTRTGGGDARAQTRVIDDTLPRQQRHCITSVRQPKCWWEAVTLEFLREFLKYRGLRVVTCPETHDGAAVSVDALFAATWDGALRLSTCSRWPERADCGQTCLTQIAAAPDGCLLHSIVTAWYAGKSCVRCNRPIGKIVWHEAPPALLAADGTTFEWKDALPQDLPVLFRTRQPLCWYCNNVAELRRMHPELIFDRQRPAAPPPEPLRSDAVY